MEKQSPPLDYPVLDSDRWTTTGKDAGVENGNHLDSDDFYADPAAVQVETAVVGGGPDVSTPVSAVMEETLWTVHAEDTIEKVEELLTAQGLASVPVMGSNGEIVGMIGTPELALFRAENKNAKAVRAWEISRCRTFEVAPGDSIEEVAQLMADNKLENMAVTTQGALQGVVSVHDLVQVILKESSENAAPDTQLSVEKRA